MTMSANSWLLVAMFLTPPWVVFGFACYWKFIDDDPPVSVAYQHPKFLRHEAQNRTDAVRYETDSVNSGDFVWVYREICTARSMWGSARGSWVSGSFVWQTPERAVAPMAVGCHPQNFNVPVPTSDLTRDFSYQVEWAYENNPLVTTVISMPSIRLRVYADNDGPTKMNPK